MSAEPTYPVDDPPRGKVDRETFYEIEDGGGLSLPPVWNLVSTKNNHFGDVEAARHEAQRYAVYAKRMVRIRKVTVESETVMSIDVRLQLTAYTGDIPDAALRDREGNSVR